MRWLTRERVIAVCQLLLTRRWVLRLHECDTIPAELVQCSDQRACIRQRGVAQSYRCWTICRIGRGHLRQVVEAALQSHAILTAMRNARYQCHDEQTGRAGDRRRRLTHVGRVND